MYITWIYDLKGARRKLYHGNSYTRAEEVLDVAHTVIETFELDCTLLKSRPFGLDGDVKFQLDFKNGEHRRDANNDLRLSLD